MRAAPPRIALVSALLCLGAAAACKKSSDSAAPASAPTSAASAPDADSKPVEDPEESPYLDVSNFNDVVESHLPEIVACYDSTAGKAADPPMGRVKATLVINADGRVKDTSFDAQRSTLKDPALDACIKARAAEWKFNISLTGADTPMPYTFDLSQSGLLKR